MVDPDPELPDYMGQERYTQLTPQQRRKVCRRHGRAKIKNAIGKFVCPVCVVEDELDL